MFVDINGVGYSNPRTTLSEEPSNTRIVQLSALQNFVALTWCESRRDDGS